VKRGTKVAPSEQTWPVTLVIIILLSGLVVGALGRLVIPGPNPMSLLTTILVGVGGAILGGLLGSVLFGTPGGFVLSVVGAALIVLWIERSRARRAGML
jgi:uncharacterized membrane protein YeaQ/YmgE (transglycosylase-associated protein family)